MTIYLLFCDLQEVIQMLQGFEKMSLTLFHYFD